MGPADSSVREVPTVGSIAQCSATEATSEVAEAEVVSEVLVVEDSLAEEQVEVGNILKLNNF